MKVYLLFHNYDDYRSLDCDEGVLEYIVHQNFDARPLGDTWRPFRVWWSEEEKDRPKGDFPLGAFGFVVGERVLNEIGDTLLENGELLPLIAAGEKMFLYNVTTVVDVMDESKTHISDHHIYKHYFIKERVRDCDIFKIPQAVNGSEIYLTDKFLKKIEVAGLTGLRPREVWSSESGSTWHPLLFGD